MRFPGHLQAPIHPHAIPLPLQSDSSQICTIYEGLKHLPETVKLRVKTTDNGLLLYASNKSGALEKVIHKNSSLQDKRRALISLISKLGNDYAKSGPLNSDQRGALERLRHALANNADAVDFTAAELKRLLKPLSNSVRTRKLLLASKIAKEQSEIGNEPLRDAEGRHYQAFINIDNPTKNLLKLALFGPQSRAYSLRHQRSIVGTFFSLVEAICNKKASRTTTVRLIRDSKDKDGLLTFSIAWQAVVAMPRGDGKILDKMSWKPTISKLSLLIQRVLSRSQKKAISPGSPAKNSTKNSTKTSPVKSPDYVKNLQYAQFVSETNTSGAKHVVAMSTSIFHDESGESDVLVSSPSPEDMNSRMHNLLRRVNAAARFVESPFAPQKKRNPDTSAVKEFSAENSVTDHSLDEHSQ